MPKLRPTRASVLCDQLLYLGLSCADLEDLFLGYQEPKPRQYKSSGGLLDVNSFDEEEFGRMFRFEKQHLDLLEGGTESAGCNPKQPRCESFGPGGTPDGSAATGIPQQVVGLRADVRVVNKLHVETTFGHLLGDLNSHQWLTVDDLPELAEVSTCLLTLPFSVVYCTRQSMKYRRLPRLFNPPTSCHVIENELIPNALNGPFKEGCYISQQD
ncbi:hypothetical protein HPB48_007963 [Haemaphysalis longicornis]|uniref:Uncharacterized protein n=1 Tax=Haemaphysalis longicornis TaxID=44386 RepID=A0A9J6FRY8_HAELO|nr:hypothetical protein HPB48_007963 [Haemaphysalis longicornis]